MRHLAPGRIFRRRAEGEEQQKATTYDDAFSSTRTIHPRDGNEQESTVPIEWENSSNYELALRNTIGAMAQGRAVSRIISGKLGKSFRQESLRKFLVCP